MKPLGRRGGCHSAWIGRTAIAVVMMLVGTASLSHALPPDRRGMGTDPSYANGTSTNLESYVKLYAGATFNGRFESISVTSGATGLSAISPGIKSSALYGGKLGVFPWRWVGLEAEVFSTTAQTSPQPVTFSNRSGHVRTTLPGMSDRVTVLAFNAIVRYPGRLLQPYAGIGPGIFFASASDNSGGDSDTALGLNVLAGLNVRITENLGVFTEYKYDKATLHFDRVITVASPIGAVSMESPYHNSAIVVGLGWHF